MARDEIYRRSISSATPDQTPPFEFSDEVAKVFPDMIERSVPGYRLLLDYTPLIVQNAVQPNSRIYDLGCSLGAATLAARRAVQAEAVRIVSIDSSASMVNRCRALVEADNSRVPVDVIEADILDVPIENASVVMLYFTLQFIALEQRDTLIRKIYEGMNPGSVLLLAEKLKFQDEAHQRWLDEHHHDFKRAQGYSDLEIARKRQALENVLVPETCEQHHQRLRRAGFTLIVDWLQCFNFAAMAAVK